MHGTRASIDVQRLARIAAAALALFYLCLLISQIGLDGGWLYDSQGRPFPDDFTGVYAAGTLINEGSATAVYDWTLHKAAHARVTSRETFAYFQFPYPPTMFVTAAVLAAMPYAIAKLGWIAATFAVYLTAVRKISGRISAILFAAAAPAVLLNAYLGQNGFLTAGLLGLALVLLPARPLLSGVLIGALTIKPHLGLLIPFALMAGGHWRAIAAASATAFAMASVSVAIFGFTAWHAFADQLGAVGNLLAVTTEPEKLQSLYGLARTSGAPHEVALAAHAGLAVVVAALTIMLWRRSGVRHELKAAALVSAAFLISPYLFIYDLTGLVIAQAFLVVAGMPGYEKTAVGYARLVLPHALILSSPFIGLPAGFFAALVIFVDTAVRTAPLSKLTGWPGVAPAATLR